MSGKPAARVSDTNACPLPGHGPNPVAVGSPNVLINGMPIAHLGSATAHGGVIISGSGNVLVGSSGGGAPMSPVGALQIGGAIAAVAALAESLGNALGLFDEQFVIRDAEGEPLANLPYRITTESGQVYRGITDEQGQTLRISTKRQENLRIEADFD